MNKVILMGRCVRDAEVKYTQDSMAIARFTLAIDRRYKEGAEQSADFIPCVAFGKIAEFFEKYGNKGVKFAIEGRWQTGSYTNKEGAKVYTNDCVIERVEFAESKRSDAGAQTESQAEPQTDADGFMSIPDGIDEELPFV